MANCRIIFEGKNYVNSSLFRSANNCGDSGLVKALSRGDITAKIIFDDTIYLVDKDQLAKCQNYEPVVQNVDRQLQSLEVLINDDENMRVITVSKADLTGTIKYQGFLFIRLRDIRNRTKYAQYHRLPIIQICGSFYVAINAKNSAAKHPIVVKVGAA